MGIIDAKGINVMNSQLPLEMSFVRGNADVLVAATGSTSAQHEKLLTALNPFALDGSIFFCSNRN